MEKGGFWAGTVVGGCLECFVVERGELPDGLKGELRWLVGADSLQPPPLGRGRTRQAQRQLCRGAAPVCRTGH